MRTCAGVVDEVVESLAVQELGDLDTAGFDALFIAEI
jgi:hypothetical protein